MSGMSAGEIADLARREKRTDTRPLYLRRQHIAGHLETDVTGKQDGHGGGVLLSTQPEVLVDIGNLRRGNVLTIEIVAVLSVPGISVANLQDIQGHKRGHEENVELPGGCTVDRLALLVGQADKRGGHLDGKMPIRTVVFALGTDLMPTFELANGSFLVVGLHVSLSTGWWTCGASGHASGARFIHLPLALGHSRRSMGESLAPGTSG